ncbi:MAG: TonB-dependent receptor [Pseudomonadota bacterium]
MAGVIQIFTKKGSGAPTLTVGGGLGSYRTSKADASISGGIGGFDYAVAMDKERSHGFNAVSNPASFRYVADDDGHDGHSVNARLGWQLNASHRLELSSVYSKMDAQYDEGTPGVDDHSLSRIQTTRALWSAQWLKEWATKVQLAESVDHYELSPSFYETQTNVRTAAWQNDVQWGSHGLHLTLERREDRLANATTQYSPQFEGERSQNGVAVGYDWRNSAYGLQLNARSDDDSEFGRHDTGALAVGWQWADAWRLRASVGTAFRAPTLYQRFSEYGNANLNPESALNRELGFQFSRSGLTWDATVFRNQISNLIGFEAGRYNNISHALLKGVSTSIGVPVGSWQLSGSVDLQSPTNADTGQLLVRRARQHMSLQVDGPVSGWTLGAQVLVSGRRDDLTFDADYNTVRVQLPGYAVLNLTAQRALAPGLSMLVRVDNVADHFYQTAVDYRSNPRMVFLGLKWTMGH